MIPTIDFEVGDPIEYNDPKNGWHSGYVNKININPITEKVEYHIVYGTISMRSGYFKAVVTGDKLKRVRK